LEYFEGALADAPASARLAISRDPETTASDAIAVTSNLCIAASSRLRQVKRNRLGPKGLGPKKDWIGKDSDRRFLSTTLFSVLLSHQMMIPGFGKGKNK
jgi:hypothetical protein